MSRISLTLALRDYAHVAPFALGDVTVEGVDLKLVRAFDAPQRVLTDPTIDGGEGSFSRHLQRVAASDDARARRCRRRLPERWPSPDCSARGRPRGVPSRNSGPPWA